MSAPFATRPALEALIDELRGRESPKRAPRRVVVVRARPEWTGDEPLTVAGDAVNVVACRSSLEARVALAERDDPAEWLVLLTEAEERDLGLEVIARLPRRRIEELDLWHAVALAFGAVKVDPLLRSTPDLATLLLAHRPPRGFARVGGAVLTRDVAWSTACEVSLGLNRVVDSGGPVILSWLTQPGSRARWDELADPVRTALAQWLRDRLGVVGDIVPRLFQAGRETDAIALGLCAGLIAEAPDSFAAGQLSSLIGKRTPAELRAYGAAAAVVGDDAAPRADVLLAELGGADLAVNSDVLQSGFEERLARLGSALSAAVAGAGVADAEAALARCYEHALAETEERRIAAATMALRLVRWLEGPVAGSPASLRAAAELYASDGAYVDRARTVMWRGDPDPSLATAYSAIDAAVHTRRDTANHEFALLLRNGLETASDDPVLVGVERILHTVVRPLATRPVLLIVLDGASLAVWSELTEGLAAHGWTEVVQGEPRLGLATIPSLTTYSRTSLLTGTLKKGTQADESRDFPVALQAVAKGKAPRLFHKAELTPAAGGAIAQAAREAIENAAINVVGVVINEIDDSLSGGTQADRRWRIDEIGPLRACLDAALKSGRTVVVTADHGHVVDYDVQYRRSPKSGERSRPATGAPAADGEILLEGARVLLPDHRAIVPWTERVRYATGKSAGYHGGASLQEMVVPIAILAPMGTAVKGLEPSAAPRPTWW